MTRGRELLALVVIVVGGTLWLLVPDMQGGSLRDDSVIARWIRPPGEYVAGWMRVENRGPRQITLTGASVGDALPAGVEVLGFRARLGKDFTIADGYPGQIGPYFNLAGFEIPAGRNATIGVGLKLPAGAGAVAIADLQVDYQESGDDHAISAGHTAQVCVSVNRRGC